MQPASCSLYLTPPHCVLQTFSSKGCNREAPSSLLFSSLIDPPPAPLPYATPQAQAPGRPSPPRGSPPRGSQPGDAAGPQEPTKTLPTVEELEVLPTTVHAEGEQGPSQRREPRAQSRLEDPGMDSREAGLTPSPGDPVASEPLANPDYIFHVVFLGDSNVGKTSFLYLLHHNSFATGLTATVGKARLGGRGGGRGPRGADQRARTGPEGAIPGEAAGSVLATGPALDMILYGHNRAILLILSNYR